MNLKLIPIAMLFSVAASNVMAQTGQVTMSGTIADASCVINGLDKTISFGTFDTATVQAMAHADAIGAEDVAVTVTGCPASDTNANLKITFNPDGTGGRIMPENGSDLMGAGLILRPTAGGQNHKTEDVVTEPLVNGAATLGFRPTMIRATSGGVTGAETVTPGTISGLVNLELTTN